MKLIKLSVPGWEKSFNSREELKTELYSYICDGCRNDSKTYDTENDCYVDVKITKTSSIRDMLNTACGCEFIAENYMTDKQMLEYVIDQLDIDRDNWLYLIDQIQEHLSIQIEPEITLIESTKTNKGTFLRLIVKDEFLSEEYATLLGEKIISEHKNHNTML